MNSKYNKFYCIILNLNNNNKIETRRVYFLVINFKCSEKCFGELWELIGIYFFVCSIPRSLI